MGKIFLVLFRFLYVAFNFLRSLWILKRCVLDLFGYHEAFGLGPTELLCSYLLFIIL